MAVAIRAQAEALILACDAIMARRIEEGEETSMPGAMLMGAPRAVRRGTGSDAEQGAGTPPIAPRAAQGRSFSTFDDNPPVIPTSDGSDKVVDAIRADDSGDLHPT
jgi:hypothetical protein